MNTLLAITNPKEAQLSNPLSFHITTKKTKPSKLVPKKITIKISQTKNMKRTQHRFQTLIETLATFSNVLLSNMKGNRNCALEMIKLYSFWEFMLIMLIVVWVKKKQNMDYHVREGRGSELELWSCEVVWDLCFEDEGFVGLGENEGEEFLGVWA